MRFLIIKVKRIRFKTLIPITNNTISINDKHLLLKDEKIKNKWIYLLLYCCSTLLVLIVRFTYLYLFCPGGAEPDGFTLVVVNPPPLQLPGGVLPPPFEHWLLIAAYAPLINYSSSMCSCTLCINS
jgi:hypothetical protein